MKGSKEDVLVFLGTLFTILIVIVVIIELILWLKGK